VYASRRGIGRQRSDAVKRQRLAALICVTGCLLASAARADTIDFQGFGGSEGDSVVGSFTIFGGTNTVTFSNAVYAKAGGPRFAFQTSSGSGYVDQTNNATANFAGEVSFDNADNWFITDKPYTGGNDPYVQDPGTPIKITFGSAVSFVSFDIADLDGNSAPYEKLTATAIRETGPDVTVILDDNDSNFGDNTVNRVVFAHSGIKEITIDVSKSNIGDYVGFGIDNVTVVPSPGALTGLASMTMIGLVGLGIRRWRRR
jgi:hypothetical protein